MVSLIIVGSFNFSIKVKMESNSFLSNASNFPLSFENSLTTLAAMLSSILFKETKSSSFLKTKPKKRLSLSIDSALIFDE